jgi:hypothetical protein
MSRGISAIGGDTVETVAERLCGSETPIHV